MVHRKTGRSSLPHAVDSRILNGAMQYPETRVAADDAAHTARHCLLRLISTVAVGALLLAGCQRDAETPPPAARPVRTITIEAPQTRATTSFTGRIEAADQASLAFRIPGRLTERTVDVGAEVGGGQIIARLEPQDELNALRSARAALSAAQGMLTQADNHFERQRHLLDRGVTSQAYFETATQARKAAESQVKSAEAQLDTAEDRVRFTTLEADAPGVVTAIGAEPGEVVQAGHMIVQLARRGGRDAVFSVSAESLRSAAPDTEIDVAMADNPGVTVLGRVREVSPQADPVTRTFQIRVGLTDPPPSFRLGGGVVGKLHSETSAILALPTSALASGRQKPAVWVVDPKSLVVALRDVEVARQEPATAFIAKGLVPGDVVVTAGASSLREGQTVRLYGSEL